MATFSYRAKSQDGQTVTGAIECDSLHVASARLREQGLFPLDLKEKRPSPQMNYNPLHLFKRYIINPLFGGATTADLAAFYRQLATMVKAGMMLTEAMASLGSQGENKRLRKIAMETAAELQTGTPLSTVFARYPWMFPSLHVFLLAAGEKNGMLERMLERLATYLEQENRIRQKLRVQTLYPKILVLAVIFIPRAPVLFVAGTKAYFSATLPLLFTVLGIIATGWTVFRLLNQIPYFGYTTELFKRCIPRIGKTVRMQAEAKFYRVLSAMYEAGVPMSQGLKHAAKATGSRYLEIQIMKAVPEIEHGSTLSDALARSQALPQMGLDMLRTGERTGSVDSMLNKAAEYSESECEVAIEQNTVAVGVLLFLVLAIYVALAVIIPQYQQYGANETKGFD